MGIFDNYNELGKNNITATNSDFIQTIGEEGIKDIIIKVLMGGNVRDITEFITQRRLLNTYSATLELFIKSISHLTDSIDLYSSTVTEDLLEAKNKAKILDLWLLGLTQKGLDNIVRTEANINEYKNSFIYSLEEAIPDLENIFGKLDGTIELNGNKANINWKFLSLLFLTLGSQTLTVRGSAKSMNGKLFEKLVLGSLLSILNFNYCSSPPDFINKNDKIFWLSNIDENERETDATIVYDGNAISVDIGFIGKGNPEISLDKVTRFGAYKQIGGIRHDMSTIIIVDTVGENSGLFEKAKKVNGHIFQMKQNTWIIEFTKLLCKKLNIRHILQNINSNELEKYLVNVMKNIDIHSFINKQEQFVLDMI